jgi:hypothetical protein
MFCIDIRLYVHTLSQSTSMYLYVVNLVHTPNYIIRHLYALPTR